jgi:hypothetical protein
MGLRKDEKWAGRHQFMGKREREKAATERDRIKTMAMLLEAEWDIKLQCFVKHEKGTTPDGIPWQSVTPIYFNRQGHRIENPARPQYRML